MLALMLLAAAAPAIVTGPDAPPLERYAAESLSRYVEKLFGMRTLPVTKVPPSARAVFLIGSPATNPAIPAGRFPRLGPQGIVLKRFDSRTMIVGGASPAATLWAVSELAERWGVRHLLHRDLWPANAPAILPDVDIAQDPLLPVRGWRVVNDFACGPESWGMADYRPVIDQLAKLKFNRILIAIYPWQPFLDLQAGGTRRHWATLWYDYHYPITDDMPGRALFGNIAEFWNPDLPRGAPYPEFAAAGERLIHNIIGYAHQRGMQVVITATLSEFPPEFVAVLPGAKKVHQLAELDVVPGPGTRIEDPALNMLAAAVLRATAGTYSDADFIHVGMPEHRDWVEEYERAWNALDARYKLAEVARLEDILSSASRRQNYPGGAERAVREVKGDLASLYFFDRLLNEVGVFKGTRRSEVKFIYGSVAEELYPLLPRIVPRGAETLNFVDYTPARIVKRRQVLRNVPAREVPSSLIYTLHDDNIGLLPQLMTNSLAELTGDLRRYGWTGFFTRYWLTGDHDTAVAYLSRAAWDANATARAVARDQIRAACGDACAEELAAALEEVQRVTEALEWHALGLAFPVPGMMMKHWKPEPMPAELAQDREGYRRALALARRAATKTGAAANSYVAYWIGRLEFAIGYLDCIEAVRQAATAESAGRKEEAAIETTRALDRARRAIEAYAAVAQDQSDRGAVATLAEYVYRPLAAKVNHH